MGRFGGRIRLKAYHVDFDGAHDIAGAVIPISAATATSQGRNVFRVSVAAGWLQSNGIVRNADVGILYDPDREAECRIADALIREIKARAPELRIRRNYPSRGTSDGLTTALRQKFGEAYAGIEIEMNQALLAVLV